jgi:hypothetical protein
MDDIAEAMTMNLFPHARMGWEHTGRLLRLLERAYVEFVGCSYSDTCGEYDITFIFENIVHRLIGGCGSRLEFHPIGRGQGYGFSMLPDPPNVETIAYRMAARLRGEKVDYHRVLPSDMPFEWYSKGEVRPWRDGPDCQLPPPDHPYLNPQSLKRGILTGGQDDRAEVS